MKKKIIAFLIMLSINGMCSIRCMGEGDSINTWRTFDKIAEENLNDSAIDTKIDVLLSDQQAAELIAIKKETMKENALKELLKLKVKREILFKNMKKTIEEKIKEINENEEISDDEAAIKVANHTKLLKEVISAEIAEMNEIATIMRLFENADLSQAEEFLRYLFEYYLDPPVKRKVIFSVVAEDEAPEYFGKIPAEISYTIQENQNGTVSLQRFTSATKG